MVAQITPALADGTVAAVRYVLQDAKYNVVSIARACDGALIRQFRYGPYGEMTGIDALQSDGTTLAALGADTPIDAWHLFQAMFYDEEFGSTRLDGAYYAIHAVAPVMKRQGEGWIINIASLASRTSFAGGAAYNASKFGLLGLSDAAMLDLRPHGIRVSAVLPGSVDTDFLNSEKDESWMLRAEDVARAVVDLLAYPGRALPSRIELRPTYPA